VYTDTLSSLISLTELGLNDNRLSTLPASVAALTRLKSLSVMDNRITHISPAIGGLTRLTHFNVTHNVDLSCPPPEVYTQGVQAILSFLQKVGRGYSHGQIELAGLRIETLSLPWTSLAPGLRALLLSRNMIKALPDSVCSLTALTALWVDNNQISTLPSNIGRPPLPSPDRFHLMLLLLLPSA
jgi:Leucine-rich repeat (LRR) protein